MRIKSDLIANYITQTLDDVPNILNDVLSVNDEKFNYRQEYEYIINFIHLKIIMIVIME